MLSRRTLLLLAVAALASAADDAQPKPPGLSEFRKDVRTLLASQPAQAAKLLKEAFAKLPPAGDAEEEGYSPTQEHADLLSDLAEAYLRSGEALKAIDVLEEAGVMLRKLHGASSPMYGVALNRLGDAHFEAGKYAEAAGLYKLLLPGMRKDFAGNVEHPALRKTIEHYARASAHAGKHGVAAKAYAELIDTVPPGAESREETAELSLKAASEFATAGKPKAALPHAEKARELFAAGVGGDDDAMRHAMSLNGLAGVLERLDRHDEALAAMAQALEIARAQRGDNDPIVASGRKNLAGLQAKVNWKLKQAAAAAEKKKPGERTIDEALAEKKAKAAEEVKAASKKGGWLGAIGGWFGGSRDEERDEL